ncbi:hypothetical protein V8G54_001696 [Vigna mungo]|uniref:Uncharacterized protein n=1 Tax=Vigna mungo TaxID=3915 RepID=A0AAQ3P9X0_VIGMU
MKISESKDAFKHSRNMKPYSVSLFLHYLYTVRYIRPTGNDLNTKIHDDENHTVGRRLLTLPSFELIPPNVERWKTSAPSVACACEITLSICSPKIGRTVQNKTSTIGHKIQI